MREPFRRDAAGRHALQAVVANRRGGAQRLLGVAGLELDAAGLEPALPRDAAWPQRPAKQSACSSRATDADEAPDRGSC